MFLQRHVFARPDTFSIGTKNIGKLATEEILEDVHDLSDCSKVCDLSVNEMIKVLSSPTRSNIRIFQRDIKKYGIRYNIIEYDHWNSNERRTVIAIRGTKNIKNIKLDLDGKLEYDDSLGIQIHRGFKKVYQAILKDMLSDESSPLYDLLSTKAKSPVFKQRSLHITGHSLGTTIILDCL